MKIKSNTKHTEILNNFIGYCDFVDDDYLVIEESDIKSQDFAYTVLEKHLKDALNEPLMGDIFGIVGDMGMKELPGASKTVYRINKATVIKLSDKQVQGIIDEKNKAIFPLLTAHPISDEALLELSNLSTVDKRSVIELINKETASAYMTIDLWKLNVTRATEIANLNRIDKYVLIANLALAVARDFDSMAMELDEPTN